MFSAADQSLGSKCPDLSPAVNQNSLQLFSVWNFVTIHDLLQRTPHRIIYRIKIRTVRWPVFRFNELRHIAVQISDSVQHVTLSRRLRYGETPAVNLVRERYYNRNIITIINTVYFSMWIHKHEVRFAKFRNSNRNHYALREMFSSLQQSRDKCISSTWHWHKHGRSECLTEFQH